MDLKKMRREILNSYEYVENGTWLCDKDILYLLSNNWLSKFMQRCNFTKNKHINKNVKKLEESRVICQLSHSYFTTFFVLTIVITLSQTTQCASMVLYPLTGVNQLTKRHSLL